MLSKSEYFYKLQENDYINHNWMLNSHDFSIWNIQTGVKLKYNVWSNRDNWNKSMNK